MANTHLEMNGEVSLILLMTVGGGFAPDSAAVRRFA